MNPVQISVEVKKGLIQLSADKDSSIFGWQHRIYLVNILGFEEEADAPSLVLKSAPDVLIKLQECLVYFNENKISFALDAATEELLKKAV